MTHKHDACAKRRRLGETAFNICGFCNWCASWGPWWLRTKAAAWYAKRSVAVDASAQRVRF